MEEFIATVQPWHWLVLALVLLICESLGAGGFLIGLAIAAVVQSIIAVSTENLSWDLQLLIFAVNAVVFTVIYWRFFRKFNQQTDAPTINQRAVQYLGRRFHLTEDLSNGEGKTRIGDTLWRIRAKNDLPANTNVEVYDTDDMVLIIRAVEDSPSG